MKRGGSLSYALLLGLSCGRKTEVGSDDVQAQNTVGPDSELSPKGGRFHGFFGRPPLDRGRDEKGTTAPPLMVIAESRSGPLFRSHAVTIPHRRDQNIDLGKKVSRKELNR